MSTIQMPEPDASILSRRAAIIEALVAAIGPDGVIHEPAETIAYECDAFVAYRCPPLAVCLPSTTEEVSAVLRV